MCKRIMQIAGVSFLCLVLLKHVNRREGKACVQSPAAGHVIKMYLQHSLLLSGEIKEDVIMLLMK